VVEDCSHFSIGISVQQRVQSFFSISTLEAEGAEVRIGRDKIYDKIHLFSK
jgi:hypothetical protein